MRIASPYGLEFELREANTEHVKRLEVEVLRILTRDLNSIHAITFSERQWQIIIGPWLRYFLSTAIQRFMAIEKAFDEFNIKSYTAYATAPLDVTPIDTYQAAILVTDSIWSNNLDLLAVESLSRKRKMTVFDIHLIPAPYSPRRQIQPHKGPSGARSVTRGKVRNFARWLTQLGIRPHDSVLFDTYMSRFEVLRAHAYLRQFPLLPEILNLTYSTPEVLEVDHESRTILVDSLSALGNEPLDDFLSEAIPKQLPTNFLEGFREMRDIVDRWSLPQHPRSVVTANAGIYNDHFKVWLSSKINDGAEYVAIQHGSNYGTHRWWNPYVDELTSDRFITWGWGSEQGNYVPGFIVKPTVKVKQDRNPQALTLVEYPPAYRRTVWDEDAEFRSYFLDQLEFVKHLDVAPRSALIVRMHAESKNFEFGEKDFWQTLDPGLVLDDGTSNISQLWSRSRLIIHSYDSTGFLECLAANIPCAAFWRNGLKHTMSESKPKYELLIRSGILHLSASEAAHHVNQHWHNIGAWWHQDKTQSARMEFVNMYARVSNKPGKDLARLLGK